MGNSKTKTSLLTLIFFLLFGFPCQAQQNKDNRKATFNSILAKVIKVDSVLLEHCSYDDSAFLKNQYTTIIKKLESQTKGKPKLRKRDLMSFYAYVVQLNVLMQHINYCHSNKGSSSNSVMCENKLRELQQHTLLASADIKTRYRKRIQNLNKQ